MTREQYIVRNCPCFVKTFGWCQKVDDYGVCENTTDCVIKQVIEKCKLFQNNYLVNDGVQLLTTNILNSFDIEEINK